VNRYTVSEAMAAVIDAAGGTDHVERPLFRSCVLMTDRCQKRHALGRVFDTRIGPVWVSDLQMSRADQVIDAKREGISLERGGGWEAQPVTEHSLHMPRCRCGTPSAGDRSYRIPSAALDLLDGTGPTRFLMLRGSDLLAEIENGVYERTMGVSGNVLKRRAR